MPESFTGALLDAFTRSTEMDRQKRLDKQQAEQQKIENERAQQAQQFAAQKQLLEIPLIKAQAEREEAQAAYERARPGIEQGRIDAAARKEEDANIRAAASGLQKSWTSGQTLPQTLSEFTSIYRNAPPDVLEGIRQAHIGRVQSTAQDALSRWQEDVKDWEGRSGYKLPQYIYMSPKQHALLGIEPPPRHPGPIPTPEHAAQMPIETVEDRRIRAREEHDQYVEAGKNERAKMLLDLRREHEANAVKQWEDKYKLSQAADMWKKAHAVAEEHTASARVAVERIRAQTEKTRAETARTQGAERIGIARSHLALDQRREDRLTRHERYAPIVAEYSKAETAARNASNAVRKKIGDVKDSIHVAEERLRGYGIHDPLKATNEEIKTAAGSDPAIMQSIHAAIGQIAAGPKVLDQLGAMERQSTQSVLDAQHGIRDLGYGPTNAGGKPTGPPKGDTASPPRGKRLSPDEARKLPKGTHFLGADGIERVVR